MAELKPCPFCGGEAVYESCTVFNGCIATIRCKCGAKVQIGDRTIGMSLCDDNEYEKYGTDYISNRKAIAAWNRRAEPEPMALTVEELREMDGRPVYIVEHPKWGHWELSEYAEDYFADRDTDFYGMKHSDPEGKYGLHMLGWLAYDGQPIGDSAWDGLS